MECGFLKFITSSDLGFEGLQISHPCGAHLLNIVVRQRAAVFELFAGENQALLVGWNALLVLNLALDIVDCVGRLHLEGDGLAREGLDEAVE